MRPKLQLLLKGPSVFRKHSVQGQRRLLTSTHVRCSDFSHVVIGGGIVGLAIGSELQRVGGSNVLVLERHDILGSETTSRNSEVIHAGLYYPKDTLKAQLCVKGKEMIYQAHERGLFDITQVGLQKCGKWVVAQDEKEEEYLEKLSLNAKDLGVPVHFLSTAEAKRQNPLIRAEKAVLESPTTGIISAHDLLFYFQTQFENNEGTIALNSEVTNIHYNAPFANYEVTICSEEEEDFKITADNVINSAGLHAQKVANFLLPPERHYKSYFAKGTYYSYQPENPLPTSKITDKLIYPCPKPNASALGTHLTFDLGGQLRFGPDVEWLNIKDADEINYYATNKNTKAAYQAIKQYFPMLNLQDLQPSYTGVRPKIMSELENKKNIADFIIKEESGFPGFINLFGIESPGLTSAWAIGELVSNMYYKH